MIDPAWFESVGREHFRSFFRMIEAAMKTGQARGLRITRPNAAKMMEWYRGRGAGRFKGS